jgi:hypothetical protein
MDDEKIAIYTHLDEPISDDNKYYLQRHEGDSTIIAITGSMPLYIFQIVRPPCMKP